MKTVKFIRHYKLEPSFNNWKVMTWENFKSLTEGNADPDISYDGIENVIKSEIISNNIEQIITGTKLRTINTADKIIKHLHLSINIYSHHLFDEIPSIIEQNVSESQFKSMQENGRLEIIKHRTLNNKESLVRLQLIDEFIRNSIYNNILIVSSSYLIGLLNYFYYFFDKTQKFNIEEAKKYEIGGWLKGFDIKID